MALNPLYIPLYNLQQELLDKTTGLPLAGGVIYFFSDSSRNTPKSVFQLTGAPPNYNYAALPNPITLSNAGTITDGSGNDITIYAYPYDSAGNPDNYYIQVFAQPSVPPFPPVGTPILTREAVPGVTTGSGPNEPFPDNTGNALSNPQFAEVVFDPVNGMSIAYMAGMTTAVIAPDWTLKIIASSSGTVGIVRNAIAGSSAFATNPPYSLTVTTGSGISSLKLYQRLSHNPNIWSTPSPNPSSLGWISASIALAPSSSTVTMFYAPSSGPSQQILSAANSTSAWRSINLTSQLDLASNPNTSTTGYVDIVINLPTTGSTTFSSVQLIGLNSGEFENVPFDQEPVNRQVDHLFHYYKQPIFYKQTPSYLVGWDFPLNPAQINGDTLPVQAIGANTGFYAWDQTIVFQTTNSGVSVARGINGTFQVTAAQNGSIALVQYLDQIQARKILNDKISVNISQFANIFAGGLEGKVTLWATADTNLPTLPLCAVSALDADGNPTMGNGTWTVVPNIYQNNTFIFTTASGDDDELTDIQLNGWDMGSNVLVGTAKFFAIVVSFKPWLMGDSINFNSISCCPGDIPSRPAPKTPAETRLACNEYFWTTFAPGTVPAQAVGVGTGEIVWQAGGGAAVSSYWTQTFPVAMRTIPTVTTYNPLHSNAEVLNERTSIDCAAGSSNTNTSRKSVLIGTTNSGAGGQASDPLAIHLAANALLGVVN